MCIKIKNKIFDERKLEMLESINYSEFKEFLCYTETLYKSSDGSFIIETQYQRNPKCFEEEISSGKMTDKDMELKTEYRIVGTDEADNFLEDAVWHV